MAVCVYLMQAAFTTCKGIRCFPFLSFFLVLCLTRGNANARCKRSLNLRNFFFFSLHCFSFLCFLFKLRLIILVEHSGTLIIWTPLFHQNVSMFSTIFPSFFIYLLFIYFFFNSCRSETSKFMKILLPCTARGTSLKLNRIKLCKKFRWLKLSMYKICTLWNK